MKKRMLALLLIMGLTAGLVMGCGAGDSFKEGMNDAINKEADAEDQDEADEGDKAKEDSTDDAKDSAEETDSADSDGNGILDSGTYTLPSGVELSYTDYVRNDVTDNWRISLTANGTPPEDYAMEYYENMFSNDEEIHGIVNFTLKTTTCIKVMSGCLFVDTHEYIDGEEHDAKVLFGGELLSSKVFSLETGEEMNF